MSRKTKKRGKTLCSLNLNGIRAAANKGLLEWLERNQPDWLCLQELRALPEQVPDEVRAPAGYAARWNPAQKKGYAGTALFSREVADHYEHGTGLDWGDAEGRCVRGCFPELEVLSLYVPSGSSSEERQERKFAYLDHLAAWMAERLAEGRPMAICGDYNIAHTELDIWSPKTNAKNSGFLPEERAWFTRLLESGWVDAFRAQHVGEPGLYSWWSNRGQARAKDRGWRIDYCLLTPSLAERVTDAWIDKEAGLSDHAPVFLELDG